MKFPADTIESRLIDSSGGGINRCEWLNPDAMPEWDSFANQHPFGTVWHQSAWDRVMRKAFPHICGGVLAIRAPESGRLVAGLPVYSVRSWILGNKLVSVPFATWCDPLANCSADATELVATLSQISRADGGRRLEVRGLWMQREIQSAGLQLCKTYKHHFIPLDRSLDQITAQFSRTAVRRMISKAQKDRITVAPDESGSALTRFIELLDLTRRRLGLFPIPPVYIREIWTGLQPNQRTLFVARRDGVPVAAVLTLQTPGLFVLEYYGENECYRGSGANQLLYSAALRTAHASGHGRFSFGRTSCEDVGLLNYKRHWGPVEEELGTYRLGLRGELLPGRTRPTWLNTLVALAARRLPLRCAKVLGRLLFNQWA